MRNERTNSILETEKIVESIESIPGIGEAGKEIPEAITNGTDKIVDAINNSTESTGKISDTISNKSEELINAQLDIVSRLAEIYVESTNIKDAITNGSDKVTNAIDGVRVSTDNISESVKKGNEKVSENIQIGSNAIVEAINKINIKATVPENFPFNGDENSATIETKELVEIVKNLITNSERITFNSNAITFHQPDGETILNFGISGGGDSWGTLGNYRFGMSNNIWNGIFQGLNEVLHSDQYTNFLQSLYYRIVMSNYNKEFNISKIEDAPTETDPNNKNYVPVLSFSEYSGHTFQITLKDNDGIFKNRLSFTPNQSSINFGGGKDVFQSLNYKESHSTSISYISKEGKTKKIIRAGRDYQDKADFTEFLLNGKAFLQTGIGDLTSTPTPPTPEPETTTNEEYFKLFTPFGHLIFDYPAFQTYYNIFYPFNKDTGEERIAIILDAYGGIGFHDNEATVWHPYRAKIFNNIQINGGVAVFNTQNKNAIRMVAISSDYKIRSTSSLFTEKYIDGGTNQYTVNFFDIPDGYYTIKVYG